MKSAVAYQDSKLFCEQVPLERIATEVGTPTYVYSAARLRANSAAYQDAFGRRGATTCFAMKANANVHLLREMAAKGLGADVATVMELDLALQAGMRPENIVFGGLGKTVPDMEAGLQAGVACFNVESWDELVTLDRVARDRGTQARVLFRFNPDIDADTHPALMVGKKETQFGFEHDGLLEMIAATRELSGIDFRGIHYHIGSQIEDLAPFREGAEILASTVREVREAGFTVDHLNIGGGLGIAYEGQTLPSVADLAETVWPLVEPLGCRVFLEPGRSIIGDAGILLTRVLVRKKADNRHFLILDVGMNDLLRPALYGAQHDLWSVRLRCGEKGRLWQVIGPVCECDDVFGRYVLSIHLEQGELMALLDTGAYGYAMASNYNGRPRPAEVLVDGEGFRVIRERETLARISQRVSS